MKRISPHQAAELCSGTSLEEPFHSWPQFSKEYWTKAAERINKHFLGDPQIDEQSNECPIPTIQEGA